MGWCDDAKKIRLTLPRLMYIVDKSFTPTKWIKLGKISSSDAKRVLTRYEQDKTYLRLDLDLPPSQLTFSEMADEFLEWARPRYAQSTHTVQRNNLKVLKSQFGLLELHKVTCEKVEEWLLSQKYKPWTWREYAKLLQNVFKKGGIWAPPDLKTL